ncbi:tetratricopeptide repeat protein [Undibacterium sp.]|jgi:tetratricopeptide (TPR) repeat protein|uniref:tetratricopeptide repeat protein n=1 Tax=Undibacterium sp. TaxID=1914977 RepID=UPI002B6AB09D|nr:tetratricopeptide repeat protein [Undibacterium sp.]HTD06627.1 tetratricopeptide repeat protein [Undibacterium sp.]
MKSSGDIQANGIAMQAALDHHAAGRLEQAEDLYCQILSVDQNNPQALCLYGLLEHQCGHGERALTLMRAAVALAPDDAMWLTMLANVLRDQRRYTEAVEIYRRALQVQSADPHTGFNLGSVLQQLQRYAEAVACYRQLLALHPDFPEAHNDLGVALMALQHYDQAAASFQQALRLRPEYGEAWNNLGVVYKNQNEYDVAVTCYQTALASQPGYAKAMFNLGTIHFLQKDHDQALEWYRASLQIDAEQVEAHQNVAAILLDRGELEAAQFHRDCAYRRQAVFIDHAETALKTVLVLWAAGKGNIPIDFLWPKASYTRIVCMMEYVSNEQMLALPAYDLVFNAIGDADVTGPTEAAVMRFLSHCSKPVLNAPAQVLATARDRIAQLFAAVPLAVCPPTLRCATPQFKQQVLQAASLAFPLIVRPGGSHGGDHLLRLDSAEELQALSLFQSEVYYASNYVDYRSPDGFFRKYRMAFVDRQIYPYHLAISPHWIVHYETAEMLTTEWKRAEEREFLQDPTRVLGARAYAAIQQLARAMDLDFCGVDFSLLPDGRVLVFEANATMLIHPEDPMGILHYKNSYVQAIFSAFNRKVAQLTA